MNNSKLMRTQIEEIVKVLDPGRIKETCPVVLIGKAVTLFKQIYTGVINELKNTEDVKNFVSDYTGIESPKPVVISDIGYLQTNAAFLLLKLVEEAKFPVILLSTEDKVSSILLSRVKRIIKFPVNENTDNKLLPVSDAYNQVYGDSDKKVMNKVQFYAENCPTLYKLESEIPYNKYRNAMIEILGGNL